MGWQIERIFNFKSEKLWGQGFAQFGFHDREGNRYFLDYTNHRLGKLVPDNDGFVWSAGQNPLPQSQYYIPLDIVSPVYLADPGNGNLLVSSYENSLIYEINPNTLSARVLIDGNKLGLTDLHNCETDFEGNIWIHSVTAGMVWLFSPLGELLETLGNGRSRFQDGTVTWQEAQFGNIFDLRRGPEGTIYLVDSSNFCVRKIDIVTKTVTTVVGCGRSGYSGDGGPAIKATFGSTPGSEFDGPWSLAVDENGNLYIGDTQNGVVRMVESASGIISTICGKPNPIPGLRNTPHETDPFKINLPRICSLDYYGNRLFVPEWDGDLVILIFKEPQE